MGRKFIIMVLCLSVMITGCSQKKNLENMSSITTEYYMGITWNNKTYIPFCAISNSERGKQIGIVDGDEDNQIYTYKGHSKDEWLISFYHSGLMDNSMLLREINVTHIPDNLNSEYKWN